MLLKKGYLDGIKNGPVIWVDSADSEPCIGTAAAIQWGVRAEGKLFHSGLPHKGINALELCQDAVTEIQKRFYVDFPPCEQEETYKFSTPSTMKPTKISGPDNAVNQVPPWCTMEGDIRLTPFYTVEAARKAVEG
jgi:acetylornithine deacetylase